MRVSLQSPLSFFLGNGEPLIELPGYALTFRYYNNNNMEFELRCWVIEIQQNEPRSRLPVRPG